MFAAVFWVLFRILNGGNEGERPGELIGAKLVFNEVAMQCEHRYGSLTGRFDRVYQLPSGEHVPLEFKNKNDHRVHETDIAQLSLQAWLLRIKGMRTTSHGYVIVQDRTTRKRRTTKVTLYGDEKCESLIERYGALRRNNGFAKKDRGRKCKTCGHYGTCMRQH